MSTITELEASTSGSASLGIINTNFENLNTDKIEATQTVALTNKTIDGDLNTVTDLPYSSIKSTARTGLDTKIATGTAGDTDELAKWNADGDLVSTDVTITATTPTAASLDTTVPTSQAVFEAITAQLATKEKFIPCVKATDADTYVTSVGSYAVVSLDSTDDGYFNFIVPADFSTLTSVELIMIPDATETIQLDVATNIASDGEAYTNLTGSAGNITFAATTNEMTFWDLAAEAGTPFAGMTAGDVVGVTINSDISTLRIIGLLLKYS